MVEFNSDIPKGRPQLDPDYWSKLNNKDNQNPNAIFDVNTNFALKDLSDISVFKGKNKFLIFLLFLDIKKNL